MDEIENSLTEASVFISRAESIIFASGPEFRNPGNSNASIGIPNEAEIPDSLLWPTLVSIGLEYTEFSNWFKEDSNFAWDFWKRCFDLFRCNIPHRGYEICLEWSHSRAKHIFSITSAIDSYWLRAGFNEAEVYEMKGSVNFIQCSKPCRAKVWPLHTMNIEEINHKLRNNLPIICQYCNREPSRPNVLMEPDRYYVATRLEEQENNLNEFSMNAIHTNVVILVLGVDVSHRGLMEEIKKRKQFLNATIIHIHPNRSSGQNLLSYFNNSGTGKQIYIPLQPLDALIRLNRIVRVHNFDHSNKRHSFNSKSRK